MGAPLLEGSQVTGARKSAFRPAVPLSELSLKPDPNRRCQSRRVQEAPVLSLWTRAVFASSEHPSVKERVTSTRRKSRPLEAPQVEGKGHPSVQSEEGEELPPGALRHRCGLQI